MKTQIISVVAAVSILPFLAGCDQSQAQPAESVKNPPSYKYTIIRVATMGDDSVLDNYVEKGWEPISIGGGEGMGSGQTAVLLRRLK